VILNQIHPDRFDIDERNVRKVVETVRYVAEFGESEEDTRAVNETWTMAWQLSIKNGLEFL